jgi:hypothetical protein
MLQLDSAAFGLGAHEINGYQIEKRIAKMAEQVL